jgi:hypothetical protein
LGRDRERERERGQLPNDCQQNRHLSNKNLTLQFEPNLITKIKQAICYIFKLQNLEIFGSFQKNKINSLLEVKIKNFRSKRKKKEKKSLQGIDGGQIEEECEWV